MNIRRLLKRISLHSIKCFLGFHNWSVFGCMFCGKRRHRHHAFPARIRCFFGFHDWDGCTCSICDIFRHVDSNFSARIRCHFGFHDWDGCRCSICDKTRDTEHEWDGCRCKECNKLRDEGHDWSKDCEKCQRCGKTRAGCHTWHGCRCSSCGKTRDTKHEWQGCQCSRCGKNRDEGHDWSKDCEKCQRCGKTRAGAHIRQGCKCSLCAEIMHDWSRDFGQCSICGLTNAEHIELLNLLTEIKECNVVYKLSYGETKKRTAITANTTEEILMYLLSSFRGQIPFWNKENEWDANSQTNRIAAVRFQLADRSDNDPWSTDSKLVDEDYLVISCDHGTFKCIVANKRYIIPAQT